MKKYLGITLFFLLCLLFFLPASLPGTPNAGTVGAASKKIYKNTLRREKKKLYYYDANGKKVKNCWKTIKKNRYYFTKDGSAAVGWRRINGRLYYFRPTGIMVKSIWIGHRYFGKNGMYDSSKKPKLARLKKKLKSAIKHYRGTWSVYVKNLDTNESFSINNKKVYAASLIKLYAMGAAYQRIKEKKLKASSVKDLISPMIIESDNSAFNSIVKKIGKSYINKWCRANGFDSTNQGHGLSPSNNNYGLTNGSGSNVTTVKDCGIFLERVYRGTCVSKSASKKMLRYLKRQSRRWKIPAGVPSGVTVANKTGETDDVTHDAAIVYSKGADYILVVMVRAPNYGWSAAANIPKLSRIVYRYFNG